MPDWTYHTLIRPTLARVPPTRARDLLLRALGHVATAPRGPAIIAALGHMQPPRSLHRQVLGIDLSTPTGLSAGMDPKGLGTAALAHFGLGSIELGPVTEQAVGGPNVERRPAGNSLWFAEDTQENPGIAGLLRRLDQLGPVPIPYAARLSYRHGAGADEATAERLRLIAALSSRVAWFAIDITPDDARRWGEAALHAHITTLIRSSPHAVLLAIHPDLDPADLTLIVRLCVTTRVRGVVVGGGVRSDTASHGRLSGARAHDATVATIRSLRQTLRPDTVLIAADGIVEPHDALVLIDSGADLIQLSAGFVVAGPGLPKRINEGLTYRARDVRSPGNTGWFWFFLLGLGMAIGGTLAWYIGATRVVLPYDEAFVGFNRAAFEVVNPRLLPFMQHDRVTLAGTMLSIGILYLGLAWGGVRHGDHWARRALVLSASVGFTSFLLFLGFGYFDPLHALVTLLLIPFFLLGLRGSASAAPTVPVPDLHNDRAWMLAAWGQLLMVGLGGSTLR